MKIASRPRRATRSDRPTSCARRWARRSSTSCRPSASGSSTDRSERSSIGEKKRRGDLRQGREVRGLRLQPLALGGLRAGRLPDRLAARPTIPSTSWRALLTTEKGGHRPARQVHRRVPARWRIPSCPPDVNVSGPRLHGRGGQASGSGLAAVKNVGRGRGPLDPRRARARRPVRVPRGFCAEVDRHHVNKRALESLIKAGCLDSLGQLRPPARRGDRSIAMGYAQRIQDEGASGQGSLFGATGGARHRGAAPRHASRGRPSGRSASCSRSRRETLGFYLTGHPLNEHQDLLKEFATHTTVGVQRDRGR